MPINTGSSSRIWDRCRLWLSDSGGPPICVSEKQTGNRWNQFGVTLRTQTPLYQRTSRIWRLTVLFCSLMTNPWGSHSVPTPAPLTAAMVSQYRFPALIVEISRLCSPLSTVQFWYCCSSDSTHHTWAQRQFGSLTWSLNHSCFYLMFQVSVFMVWNTNHTDIEEVIQNSGGGTSCECLRFITWYPWMTPLWVSWGGGSQLRWMVLFSSWFTVMDTASGEALGTVELSQTYYYLTMAVICTCVCFRKKKDGTWIFSNQTISHPSLELWGAGCCSPFHTSYFHRDELWTRTCSLSLKGPPESGSWAVSPSLLPSPSWQAAGSDREPRSHQGSVAVPGGTGAGQGERTVWLAQLKYSCFLWNPVQKLFHTFHCTWDMLDPGAMMVTFSRATLRVDSSLWRSFCIVLATSGKKEFYFNLSFRINFKFKDNFCSNHLESVCSHHSF